MILGVSVWALHVAILTKLVQAAFNVLKRQGQVLVREAATATTSEARSKEGGVSKSEFTLVISAASLRSLFRSSPHLTFGFRYQ